MSSSARRDLPTTVAFRVTADQAARLAEASRPLSPGQYARQIALAAAGIDGPRLGRQPLPRVQNAALLRDVLAEMGHWGGNLNQIAHILNQGQPLGLTPVDHLRAELEPIKRRLLAALGVLE